MTNLLLYQFQFILKTTLKDKNPIISDSYKHNLNLISTNKFLIICNMLQTHQQKPFPFDLGLAFPILFNYLTMIDKLNLSSTCTLLRSITMKNIMWKQLQITDSFPSNIWQSYLNWIDKYIQIIQPYKLSLTISNEQLQNDQNLLGFLLKKKNSVNQLSIRTQSSMIQLAAASSCPNTQILSIMSNNINDEMVRHLFKYLINVSQFQIGSDALEFTCENINQYLTHPLQKLVLKPHRLNYSSIIDLVSNQELNMINQLQIDVQQCQQSQLIKITSCLHHITRLRFYHLEGFDNPKLPQILASCLSTQMVQLALTKCYYLNLYLIIKKIASIHFEILDLTQAAKLTDDSIIVLSQKCFNLKSLNLSWCNQLTNQSIAKIIQNCPSIEKLNLSGIKNLNDQAFKEYKAFKQDFNEKYFDYTKHAFRKDCKKANESDLHLIEQQYKQKTKLQLFFKPREDLKTRRKTLTNIRTLYCQSCNSVSDAILKIIHCFNRLAEVVNYYGQNLGFFRNTFQSLVFIHTKLSRILIKR